MARLHKRTVPGNRMRKTGCPAKTVVRKPRAVWPGPSPLPRCVRATGQPGAKAPGQRPTRPRRALRPRRVGRWPAVFLDRPIYRAPSRRGGGNAVRFLVPPGAAFSGMPGLSGRGHRPGQGSGKGDQSRVWHGPDQASKSPAWPHAPPRSHPGAGTCPLPAGVPPHKSGTAVAAPASPRHPAHICQTRRPYPNEATQPRDTTGGQHRFDPGTAYSVRCAISRRNGSASPMSGMSSSSP